jgi:hypothetical protein
LREYALLPIDIARLKAKGSVNELVVAAARASLGRRRQLRPPPNRFAVVNETAEEARIATSGTELQLVAVLLLDADGHVDLVIAAAHPLDVHGGIIERLEVAELVDPPQAVLQGLCIEGGASKMPSSRRITSSRVCVLPANSMRRTE